MTGRRIIRLTAGLLSLLAAALLVLPVPALADKEEEVIGLPEAPGTFLLTVPLSGPLAPVGQYAREGAELALKMFGGGFRLEVTDEFGDVRDDLDPDELAMVIGYFTEGRFAADAPRYLYLKKPVILPFLTTAEAASRGPGTFFRLMPTPREQGIFMALETLGMRKRPRRILIIQGSGAAQEQLAAAFADTLFNPPPPESLPPAAKGQKTSKAPPPVKPLDSKALVLSISVGQALAPGDITELAKDAPDLVVLAVSLDEALQLAPELGESNWAKSPFWGGATLGFRDVGAAFNSLELKLSVLSPVTNLGADNNSAVREFVQRYLDEHQKYPTWISALAYDGLNLAIKAASAGGSTTAILAFLNGEPHHSLGRYDLSAGGDGGSPPMDFMPVTESTLGFLP